MRQNCAAMPQIDLCIIPYASGCRDRALLVEQIKAMRITGMLCVGQKEIQPPIGRVHIKPTSKTLHQATKIGDL